MHARILTLTLLALWGPVPAFAQDAAQDVTVTLSSYAFAPKAILLKAGVPVRLHLVNSASKSHSFTAKEFFAAATLAPDDASKLHDGEIELDAGQSVDVQVTPNKPGAYPLRCSHFLHAGFGMTGTITVQ